MLSASMPVNLKLLILFGLGILFAPGIGAQTTWFKDEHNPVLTRDTVLAELPNDLIAISDPWVIKEGDTYKIWYTCGGLNFPPDTLLRSRICYATSVDGINWNKFSGNPVLDVSYDGSWDSLGVETVSIIIDPDAPADQRYKMWYAGQYFNSIRYDIGYAYSTDGIHWTKLTSPVLTVGNADEWDNGFLEGPTVIKDDGTYKMWYCGYDAVVNGDITDGKANIGYAISEDGIHWTKHVDNPIVVTGINAWDSIYVQDPHVIKKDDTYQMWYGGGDNDVYFNQQVGYATSDDGIHWNKYTYNPVLTKGGADAWDKILASFPAVIEDIDGYKMWYTGRNLDPLPENSLDYFWELGFATAPFNAIAFFGEENKLLLHPNPATDNIAIECNHCSGVGNINVFNAQGIQVYNNSTNIEKAYTLSTSDFSDGMYFIEIQMSDFHVTGNFIILK